MVTNSFAETVHKTPVVNPFRKNNLTNPSGRVPHSLNLPPHAGLGRPQCYVVGCWVGMLRTHEAHASILTLCKSWGWNTAIHKFIAQELIVISVWAEAIRFSVQGKTADWAWAQFGENSLEFYFCLNKAETSQF